MSCGTLAAFCCCLGLTGCAAQVSLRYAGEVQPTSGTCRGGPATLQTRRGEAVFAQDDSVLLLSGPVAPDGGVSARLVQTGADGKPYVLALKGRVLNDRFDGRLSSPSCRATVALRRMG